MGGANQYKIAVGGLQIPLYFCRHAAIALVDQLLVEGLGQGVVASLFASSTPRASSSPLK